MGTLSSFEEVLPPSWPTFLNLIHQPPLTLHPRDSGSNTLFLSPYRTSKPRPRAPSVSSLGSHPSPPTPTPLLSSSISGSDYLAQCPPSAVWARGGM